MRQIARVPPGFLGLFLVMRDQAIEFVDERGDFFGQFGLFDPLRPAAAHIDNRLAEFPERPQAIERLQRRHQDQAEAEQGKTADQCFAQGIDLRIEPVTGLRDLKAPHGL